MEATDDAGSWGTFNPQPLGASRDLSLTGNFDRRPLAKDVGPPGASGRRVKDAASLLFGQVPGGLRSGADLSMFFESVVMAAQRVQIRVGRLQIGDLLGFEKGRETFLPELMAPFDFAFGLRGGSKAQGDIVEGQGRAQLRVSLGILSKEEAVIIDVKTKGQAGGKKSQAQELQMGQKRFALVKTGADDETAVVVHQVQQARLPILANKPAVRGGVVLPELSHLTDLPAADGFAWAHGRLGLQTALESEPAHGGAIQREVKSAQGFGGDQAVGTRRFGAQQARHQVLHRFGPRRAVVAARKAWNPLLFLAPGTCLQEGGKKFVEARPAQEQVRTGPLGGEDAGAKAPKDIPNVWRTEPFGQLRGSFIPQLYRRRQPPARRPCSPWAFPSPPRERPKGEQSN